MQERKWELMPGQIKSCRVIHVTEGALALKRFRESMGLSQRAFGRSMCMSSGQISDYEKGVARITPMVAYRIEKQYGIPSKLLLEE